MKLADIIDTFISGDWGEESPTQDTPNAAYCVRGADIVPITNHNFTDIPQRYVCDRTKETKLLAAGDLVIEKSGGSPTQSTGRIVYVSEDLIKAKGNVVCSNFCTAFRVKAGWNPLYVYYFWQNVYNHGAFFNFEGKTSGIKNLQLDNALSAIDIEYLPLEKQNQIVASLASIDEKIKVNRQINDNLEQQVQALFKAWFVDFEPFKDGEFVDSELGMIPKAWKIKPLEYLVEKVKSGDWGKDEPTGNYTKKTFCMRGADFPDIKEGNKGKMPIRYILEKNFNDKSLCDGNVVVEISGGSPTQSTGRIVLVDRAFVADCGNALICTNFCKSLEIKEDYSMFFYLLWQYLYDLRVMFIYENGSNGLKNLNVNSLIERESFVIPTKEVVSKFNSVVSDLLSTKQANGIEVSRLASLRDTLLPKLMSGELKNSEIETEK